MPNGYKKELQTIEITIDEKELSSPLSIEQIIEIVNSKIVNSKIETSNVCIKPWFLDNKNIQGNINKITKYTDNQKITNALLQLIIIYYYTQGSDLIIKYTPQEKSEGLITQTIDSENGIIILFNSENYFDFCKIVESHIANKNDAKSIASELYSLLKCYTSSDERLSQLSLNNSAAESLKNDLEFKNLCSKLNYAKKDINQIEIQNQAIIQNNNKEITSVEFNDAKKDLEEEIKELIKIYNQPGTASEEIRKKYECDQDIAVAICNHLSSYYKQPDTNPKNHWIVLENQGKYLINWIVLENKAKYLIKDYRFITLLEQCINKNLTKEITSVDDIFNLFNDFELSKNKQYSKGQELFDGFELGLNVNITRHYGTEVKKADEKLPALANSALANSSFGRDFFSTQKDAFIYKIASLSKDKNAKDNAEQLYYVLNDFAKRNGGTISDETKKMLKSSKTFMERLCSWLPEKWAETIQHYTQGFFKPMEHKQRYKFKQLNKLIINDKSISRQ
jgi:hypothetical protein